MLLLTMGSDAELAARCRQGEAAAWRELVERFSRYVYAIITRAHRLTGADAEDAFQEVFARAYERLDSLRDDDALQPWLAQLTRRIAIDRLRSAARERPSDTPYETADPRDVIAEIDEAMSVRQALDRLPLACQVLLDGFFARDQSYRDLAAELDLPQGTIASRISRCLVKLGEALRKIEHPSFVT